MEDLWCPTLIGGSVDSCVPGYGRILRIPGIDKTITLTLYKAKDAKPINGSYQYILELYTKPGSDPDISVDVYAPDDDTVKEKALGLLLMQASVLAMQYQVINHDLILYTIGNGK